MMGLKTMLYIKHINNNRGQMFVMRTTLCQQLDITCDLSLEGLSYYNIIIIDILDNLWLFNSTYTNNQQSMNISCNSS